MPGFVTQNPWSQYSQATTTTACQIDPIDPGCWQFRSDKAHTEFLVILLLIVLMVLYWINLRVGIMLKRDKRWWE